MSSENGSHAFIRSTNPNTPLACLKCGRTEQMHPRTQPEFKAIRAMREYLASLPAEREA